MDLISMHRLAATARGWIEAQPVGPERRPTTEAAYRRFAEKGVDGFAGWAVSEDIARRMFEAGTRMVALERLERGVDLLDEGLRRDDPSMAARAAAEVDESLALLRTVPPRRPGKRRRSGVEGDR